MMEHKPLEQIKSNAEVIAFAPRSHEVSRRLRRGRLERFADVLERHQGPVSLLSRIEYLPGSERLLLRSDRSPLAIAFRDPVLRAQGLAGDRLGDGIDFFELTHGEAHHLLCDCHYAGPVSTQMIAARARSIAKKMTLGEMWAKVRSRLKFA